LTLIIYPFLGMSRKGNLVLKRIEAGLISNMHDFTLTKLGINSKLKFCIQIKKERGLPELISFPFNE